VKRLCLLLLVLVLAGCTASDRPGVAGPATPAPHSPGIGALPGAEQSGRAGLSGRSASPSPSPQALPGTWWRPAKGLTWQWQLTGALDTSLDVDVYDLDAFTTPASTVAALKKAGRHTVCYVNAGAKEDFRTDAGRFPPEVIGKNLEGWPGEKWIDIRRWDRLEPVVAERFDMCRKKGFDAIEPDNVDGYSNESGFDLTAEDQLKYNRQVADLAHRYGLAVGLKNDVEQAATLAPSFDFAVNEECAKYHECAELSVFIKAGKPVFHVEYGSGNGFCATTKALGFSSMRKKTELNAWRQPC
jgi:hypothetical protein